MAERDRLDEVAGAFGLAGFLEVAPLEVQVAPFDSGAIELTADVVVPGPELRGLLIGGNSRLKVALLVELAALLRGGLGLFPLLGDVFSQFANVLVPLRQRLPELQCVLVPTLCNHALARFVGLLEESFLLAFHPLYPQARTLADGGVLACLEAQELVQLFEGGVKVPFRGQLFHLGLDGLCRVSKFRPVGVQVRVAMRTADNVNPVLPTTGGALVEEVAETGAAFLALAGLTWVLVAALGTGGEADGDPFFDLGLLLALALGNGHPRRGDQVPEGVLHLLGAGVSILGFHLERAQEDVVPAAVQGGVNLRGHLEGAERQSAGEHFVETDAEAVQVGAAVQSARRAELFRGHVFHGAHALVLTGHIQPALFLRQVGQAEVGDFHHLLTIDHHVAGLDVSVDHAAAMRVFQTAEHLPRDGEDFLGGQSALPGEPLLQRFTLDELHDDEVRVPLTTPVNDADNIGVVQAGQGRGLALEPLDEHAFLEELLGKDFYGNGPIQRKLTAAEDHGHSPGTEERFDDIIAQSLARAETGDDLFGYFRLRLERVQGYLGLAVRADEARDVRIGFNRELVSACRTGQSLCCLAHGTFPTMITLRRESTPIATAKSNVRGRRYTPPSVRSSSKRRGGSAHPPRRSTS